jgi:hypothetical protein
MLLSLAAVGSEHAVGFQAAAAFAGSREGRLFAMGCKGLGYYLDPSHAGYVAAYQAAVQTEGAAEAPSPPAEEVSSALGAATAKPRVGSDQVSSQENPIGGSVSVSSCAGGGKQSVATPQAARGWIHPPFTHFKIRSCSLLPWLSSGGFPNPRTRNQERGRGVGLVDHLELTCLSPRARCGYQAAGFEAAAAFAGGREGFFFARGRKGLGYYLDPAAADYAAHAAAVAGTADAAEDAGELPR